MSSKVQFLLLRQCSKIVLSVLLLQPFLCLQTESFSSQASHNDGRFYVDGLKVQVQVMAEEKAGEGCCGTEELNISIYSDKEHKHDEIGCRQAKGGESNILDVGGVKRFLNLVNKTICLLPYSTKLIIVELKFFIQVIN